MSPCGWWALTPPSHPYLATTLDLFNLIVETKRLFSSALLHLHRCLSVKKEDALCCPDFPLLHKGISDRPAGCFLHAKVSILFQTTKTYKSLVLYNGKFKLPSRHSSALMNVNLTASAVNRC